jgi:hypothetical protein
VSQSNSITPWTLNMPAGSLQQWTFTLTTTGTADPYPVAGATWEYVVRQSATSSGAPLFSVTAAASVQGVITVTATSVLSQVLLEIFPAASVRLQGVYAHALWMNPGTPGALAVAGGTLHVAAAPQP